MSHRRAATARGLLPAAALLLGGLGAYPAIEPALRVLLAHGFHALSWGHWVLLAVAGSVVLLITTYLVLVSSPAFRQRLVPLGRLSVRVAVLLLLGLVVYAAYGSRWVAFAGTTSAVLYFGVWAWMLATRTLPVIWARRVVEEQFTSEPALCADWDEVHPGAPTRMLSVSDEALRVHWAAGQLYEESGYLLKRLPAVDLRVEAELEPRAYGAGWDPGVHFYTKAGTVYCLSLGFIPKGHGAVDFAAYDGLYVRTDSGPGGYFEHTRVGVASGQRIPVVVELRGTHALVKVGERAFPVELPHRPEELVVGCFKWRTAGQPASCNVEHLIHSVKVMRI